MEALEATIRETRGKGSNRRLRSAGKLPAVVYGLEGDAQTLTVDPTILRRILLGDNRRNTLIGLCIDGAKGQPVLVRELQTNSVTREILHVDFIRVDTKAPVTVKVPVVTTGKAIGVDAGGRLKVVRRQVSLRVTPDNIPTAFAIDVSELDEGQSVRIGDCKAPEGTEMVFESNYVVVQCVTGRASRAGDGFDDEEEIAAEGEETAEAKADGDSTAEE